MNRKIRISLLTFIALSIIGLVLLVFVHYKTKDTYRVTFTEDKKVELKIDKVRYSGTRDGKVEWELTADSASRATDELTIVFKAVTAIFYSKDGTHYTLKADSGRYNEASGEIAASGDVTVEAESGYTLSTESLRYSIGSRIITSQERVTLTSGNIYVEGVGLNASVDTSIFKLLKDVKAVFKDSAI